jgi:hypothetical protein
MVPYEFSLNLPLSDLGRSLKAIGPIYHSCLIGLLYFILLDHHPKVAGNLVGQHKARFTLGVKAEKDLFIYLYYLLFIIFHCTILWP